VEVRRCGRTSTQVRSIEVDAPSPLPLRGRRAAATGRGAAYADGMGRRTELRDFLRSRRARLSPEDVGLPGAGRRRTPGLRREEVAVLAGVGVSWYTWLEQGRDITVSPQVLDAVARALRLNHDERAYLYVLAGCNPPLPAPEDGTPIGDELRRLLDAWSPRPAYVLDRHWGIVAVNEPARTVFGLTDDDHNCLVSFFTSPAYRSSFAHWEAAAPGVVAQFRADAARYPDDPEFARLAADLCRASAEFAELWRRHEVRSATQGIKAIRHSEEGLLVLEYTSLPLPNHPGHRLVLHNPRPSTGTAEKLERLAGSVVVPHP
jgi:transcriptional regulator with XRE-family HTH domain